MCVIDHTDAINACVFDPEVYPEVPFHSPNVTKRKWRMIVQFKSSIKASHLSPTVFIRSCEKEFNVIQDSFTEFAKDIGYHA
jgi:hypothetical protein